MEEKLKQLRNLLVEIADLKNTAAVLEWDQRTYMPPGGAEGRGNQLALLRKMIHERETAPELGKLLDDLKPFALSLDPDSDDTRLVKVTARLYEKSARVTSKYIVELNRVTSLGQQAWMEARARSDFSIFRPHLEKVVALRREYASFFPDVEHPYDALLDDYEPNMKTADVKTIFDGLRPKQVELIKAISGRPQVDNSFLHQPFDEKKQWDFGVEVVTRFGYDWKRGRQDKAAHPFSISFGIDDVRITTRVNPDFLNSMLFGSMHECGHAFYMLGCAPALDRTGLEGGASLALHESQSRMWENLVGRSLPFWECFYPRLQVVFPQLAGVPLEAFYKGINKVQPSFIRVEADEATYNLHIMLRLELEIALLEGSVTAQRPAGIMEPENEGIPGRGAAGRCQGRAAGHPLVHRRHRLFFHLRPRQPRLGTVVGEGQRGYSRPGGPDPQGSVQRPAGLAGRKGAPPWGQVRTAGTGAEGDRFQDRPGALPALPDGKIQPDLRSLIPPPKNRRS